MQPSDFVFILWMCPTYTSDKISSKISVFCLLYPFLQVYIDKTNVDDYLVDSIVHATEDPQAGEVYYR